MSKIMNNIINFEVAKNKLKKLNSIDEISITRSFLMYMVIMIHFSNIPVSTFENNSFWQGFFYVLRGMLIFAVPSFIFISMLMISHYNREISLKDFYKKKLLRIVIPFILWSIFYQSVLLIFGARSIIQVFDIEYLLNLILYGKSYEHLYFMPILIEFTILAPFFIYIAKKIENNFCIAIFFSISIQMIVYFANKYYFKFPMITSTFFWYLSVGFLGIWFGLNYKKNLDFIKIHSTKIFILFLVSFIIMREYQKILWQSLWQLVQFNTFPYTLNMHIFFITTIFSIIIVAKNFSFNDSSLKKYLIWISNFSYGIYLIHPIFTFVIARKMEFENYLYMLFIVFVGTFLLAHICAKITEFCEKIPILKIVFGKS